MECGPWPIRGVRFQYNRHQASIGHDFPKKTATGQDSPASGRRAPPRGVFSRRKKGSILSHYSLARNWVLVFEESRPAIPGVSGAGRTVRLRRIAARGQFWTEVREAIPEHERRGDPYRAVRLRRMRERMPEKPPGATLGLHLMTRRRVGQDSLRGCLVLM